MKPSSMGGRLAFAISVVAIGLILGAAPASASPIIEFGTGDNGSGGFIEDFGDGFVWGSGIGISFLRISFDDGLTFTVFDLFGDCNGALGDENGSSACLEFNTVEGTVSLAGAIPALGINDTDILFSGLFSEWNWEPSLGIGSFSILNGWADTDGVHPALASGYEGDWVLGLDLATTEKYVCQAYDDCENDPDEYVVGTTNVNLQATPEPTSLGLVGLGLVGLAAAIRRRSRLNPVS